MGKLADKVAVVMGAAGRDNMAQTIARRFIDDGACVVVGGRHEEELQRFVSETGAGFALCDLTCESDLATMMEEVVKAHGGIDIAVNATGWGLLKPFLDTTRADLDLIVDLQFTGSFLFYQAALRVMRNGGSILQISSATATIMLEDHAAYMGTKAGADHVIRCIANEFGSRGIRANSIAPGFTETPMTARAAANPAVVGAFEKEYPLGRVNTKADIANAAAWIASDDCFMTGQTFQVNGGLTLRRNPRNAEIVAAVKVAKAAAQEIAGR